VFADAIVTRNIDECLVRWMSDFMADRTVRMVVDQMEVTTCLPPGLPVSPVVFAIYMADIHDAIERQDVASPACPL
jgi:hypothetical protein